MEQRIPKIGEVYRHYKGGKYVIIGFPIDANYNDGREVIEYMSIDNNEKHSEGVKFISSLERFCSEVKLAGEKLRRFEKINI